MNELIHWGGNPLVHRLGWTLLHFLWQGAVIAGLFAVAQTGQSKRSGNARYLTGCLALLLMAAAPVITFRVLGVERTIPVALSASGTGSSPSNPRPFSPTAGALRMNVRDGQPGASIPAIHANVNPPPVASSVNSEKFIPAFVIAWLLGVSALTLRLLFSSLHVARLKRRGNEPAGAAWITQLQHLKAALQISRPVRLVKSALVEVPTVVGWLRPVILLPAASLMGLTPAQLESILAHELAHIRRHDYLVNLLQNALETLLFYHPAVWWISSCVRAEREICCDEIAVQVCGDRLVYAQALTTLEQLRGGSPSLALGADGGSLLERIRRLSGAPGGGSFPGRRRAGGVLVAALVAVILVSLLHHPSSNAKAMESTASLDLTGTVRGPANQPISNATVSIYAATPKEDRGAEIQSSEDCQKRATTDASGKFTIKALDTNAVFQVLFVAKGFRPMFVWQADPAARALDVRLKPASSGVLPDEQVRGRVVGPDGKPVSGAVVTVHGAARTERWREPAWDDIDDLVFTDDSGEFVIHGQLPFVSCNLTVEARGFAKSGRYEAVSTGDAVHEFRLSKGASLKGRLLKDGKPVANAGIGIAGVKADAENRNFSVATDGEGRFAFAHIPPSRDYYLYGIMRLLKDRGALSVRRVRVEGDGSSLDVGDLNLEPGFALAGRLRLANGQPAPTNWTMTLCRTVMTPPPAGEPPPQGPGSRAFLGLERNLNGWHGEIGPDGQFYFSGVPPETVSLMFMVTYPYKVSPRNASGDTAGFRLLGRVVTNKTDLVVEFEPNAQQEKPAPLDYQALSQKPLRGVEAGERPPAATSQTNAAAVPINSAKPAENPSGLSLEIRCTNDVLKVGDEIPIEFILSNHGMGDFSYDNQESDRIGRMPDCTLIAKTTSGETVPDPGYTRSYGGLSQREVLHAGASFSKIVALNRWAMIQEPGRYEVVGTYEYNHRSFRSDPISVTVLPRTKQEMSDYIQDLTNQVAAQLAIRKIGVAANGGGDLTNPVAAHLAIRAAGYDGWPDLALEGLLRKLMYTRSPEIVPALLRILYETGTVTGAMTGNEGYWASEALKYYVPHTEEVRKAIVESFEQHDLNWDIFRLLRDGDFKNEEFRPIIERGLAADKMGQWELGASLAAMSYYDDTFTARLIAIASGSNNPAKARGAAMEALACNRTEAGVKTLKTLLNDPDLEIGQRLALAIRYGYERDKTPTGRHLQPDDFDTKEMTPLIERLLDSTNLLAGNFAIDEEMGLQLAQLFGDDAWTPRLVTLATNRAFAHRANAIYALAFNRTDEGVKTLKALLIDFNPQISKMAETAIRHAYTLRGSARGRPLRPDDFDAKFQQAVVTSAVDSGTLKRNTVTNDVPSNHPPAVQPSSSGSSNEPSAINGTVLLPNGEPAAGAQVGFAAPKEQIWLKGSYLSRSTGHEAKAPIARTDAQGRFSLPAMESADSLIAAHDGGYCEIEERDLKGPLKIRLEDWGRIEGTLHVGKNPGPNEAISLGMDAISPFSPILDTSDSWRVTGAGGRFVFEHLPPGKVRLTHIIRFGNGGGSSSGVTDALVKPGEVTKVEMGGDGRQVIGQAVKGAGATFDWDQAQVQLHGPMPYQPDKPRFFCGAITGDGSFRVDDVPPGTYTLTINVSSDRRDSHVFYSGLPAPVLTKEVTVPEVSGGRSDTPVDMGTLHIGSSTE